MPDVPPRFSFDVTSWQTSPRVRAMSLAEKGAYLQLLCHQWERGHVPSDLERVARVLGVSEPELEPLWGTLQECFPAGEDGVRRNPRLAGEREAAAARQHQRRRAGARGAERRWNGERHSGRHSGRHGERHAPRSDQAGSGRRKSKSRGWEEVWGRPEYSELRSHAGFHRAWREWVAWCQEPGSKPSLPRGRQAAAQLNRALRAGPGAAAAAIEQAIANNYQGWNPDWVQHGAARDKRTPGEQACDSIEESLFGRRTG